MKHRLNSVSLVYWSSLVSVTDGVLWLLIDMEASYAEYQEWSEEPIPEATIKNYKKALQQLEKYKPYEEALVMLLLTPCFNS